MTATDTDATVITPQAPAAREHRLAATIARFRPGVIALVILVIFGLTTIRNTNFATGASIQAILSIAAVYMLLAIGESMVIITRNVDLSIGSTLGLSAFTVGELFTHDPHTSIAIAFLVGIGIGAACGAIIGVITTLIRVPSLVVTLAALYVIRGFVNIIGSGIQIEPSVFPQGLVTFGYSTVIGIPWMFLIVVAVALVAAYWMYAFPAGRELYAIGSNPAAAGLAGIPATLRVFTVFVISGALAGLGGVLFDAQVATVNSTAGTGYELIVVTAVVVGGVAIFGGSGSVIGAVLGAILLQVINQALVAARISSFWDQAIAGALLLAAISFDRLLAVRAARALVAEKGVSYVE
ncbi:MAG TPA: ABC transporter permease [Solirubrobacteraceae bacterium]|nr:ABC transporter permease [Solirubrobacteraceae bacterium]